jgi:hypothetical protein
MDEQMLQQLLAVDRERLEAVARIFESRNPRFTTVQRQQLAASGLSQTLLYGQGGLFTMCASDTLINASLNDSGLASVIPWRPTSAEVRRQPLLTHIGVGSDYDPDEDQPEDQCEDPPATTYATCEIEWCLGRIRHRSPNYDRLDQGLRWCDRQPVYRLHGDVTVGGEVVAPSGTMIQNDAEWGAVTAAVGVRQTLGRWLYTGNVATNANMFDGLEVLVNTGYSDLKSHEDCTAVDPEVKTYCSPIGAAGAPNIYAYLDAIVTRILQRATMGGFERPRAQDMLLVAPSGIVERLYEYWACVLGPCSTMAGTTVATSPQNIDAAWARQTADDLRNRGVLRIHGMDIPVLMDDYQPLVEEDDGYYADIYILTMQLGGMPVVFGEYQDFTANVGDAITGYSQELYGGRPTDGGRFYVWQERTNTCFDTRVALKPRLVILAPQVQGRLTHVGYEPLQEPIAPPPSPYAYYDGSTIAWDYSTTCLEQST